MDRRGGEVENLVEQHQIVILDGFLILKLFAFGHSLTVLLSLELFWDRILGFFYN